MEPSGPVQDCNGIDLPLPVRRATFQKMEDLTYETT